MIKEIFGGVPEFLLAFGYGPTNAGSVHSSTWTDPAMRLSGHMVGPSSRIQIEFQQRMNRAGLLTRSLPSEFSGVRFEEGVASFNLSLAGHATDVTAIPLVDLQAFYRDVDGWVLRVNGTFEQIGGRMRYVGLGPYDMSLSSDRRSIVDIRRSDAFNATAGFSLCHCRALGTIKRGGGNDERPWHWSLKVPEHNHWIVAGRDSSEEGAVAALRSAHESSHWLIDLIQDPHVSWHDTCWWIASQIVLTDGPAMPTTQIYEWTRAAFAHRGTHAVATIAAHFVKQVRDWRADQLPNSADTLAPMLELVLGMSADTRTPPWY